MLDVLPCMNQQSCLYEVRQKGQPDACYVVVPNTNDLVKSHLMFAVREEVEVLKERIAELMERINQLEVENGILRAHATPEALSQLGGVPPASAPPATVKQPAAAAGNPANGSVS